MRFKQLLDVLVRSVVVAPLASIGVPAASETVHAETRTTWMTAAQPEIHLLLQSDLAASRVLTIYFPEDVFCDGKKAALDSEKARIFDTLSRLPFPLTTGELKSNAWLHRSFPIGGYRVLRGQCVATFRVSDWTSGETLATGEIPIPLKPPAHEESSASEDNIDVSLGVERDSRFQELYLLKLLVRNRGNHSVLISESGRRFSCGQGANAEWALRPDVIQGEDSGPVVIPEQSWVVLQNAVTVRSSSIIGCLIEVEFSAYRVGEGLVTVKRFRGEIEEVGSLRRIVHGGPE